jgi:hypothetical protein
MKTRRRDFGRHNALFAWFVVKGSGAYRVVNATGFSGDRCKATWKREYKLPRREAGPPNHHDDTADLDQ